MKILDCTLRDGGYYTNWDFDRSMVEEYAKSMELLPIDYVEVGYRSISMEGYLGEYFYCPVSTLKWLKELMPSKKLVVLINEKNTRVEDLDSLLSPCLEYLTMIRIAVNPANIKRAKKLAVAIKKLGVEVAFNVMYMSSWKEQLDFIEDLEGIEESVDYFYMVDSYGGVTFEDVKEIMGLIRSKTNVPIGFHGHNNLEMALINTLTAIDEGCAIVDATITGMGRGAGNLKTELLLTYLDGKELLSFNYNYLSSVVADFEELRKQYNWGTDLAYMFSGINSLPQSQVMDWIGLNRYPLGSIVNALNHKRNHKKDNIKLPFLKKNTKFSTVIVIGGGSTAVNHKLAVQKYVSQNDDVCLVHAGSRNVVEYLDVDCYQYYCLAGFESEKLLRKIGDLSLMTQECIYPPYPRKMGTTIPDAILDFSSELEALSFTDLDTESPMALAIQTAIDLGTSKLLLIGFDGYDVNLNQNQFIMARENQVILDDLSKIENIEVKSLTPTKYKNIEVVSVYSFIM